MDSCNRLQLERSAVKKSGLGRKKIADHHVPITIFTCVIRIRVVVPGILSDPIPRIHITEVQQMHIDHPTSATYRPRHIAAMKIAAITIRFKSGTSWPEDTLAMKIPVHAVRANLSFRIPKIKNSQR